MPRLQILQHKSYHPYLEKNKQRVREDEARAREEEEERERQRIDEENEARLEVLRRRAGSPSLPALAPGTQSHIHVDEDGDLPSTSSGPSGSSKSLLERHREKKAREEKRERKLKERLDFDFPSETARKEERRKAREKEKLKEGRIDTYDVDEEGRPAIRRGGGGGSGGGEWESGGHVNFFTDIEQAESKTLAGGTSKGTKQSNKDDPFTMYLSRPEKETKPWYTDKELRRHEEREMGDEAEERRERERRKDARSKTRNDPLTHLNSLLSSSSSSKNTSSTKRPFRSHPTSTTTTIDPSAARIKREQSERERAIALISKAKAPLRPWDATPSTIQGGGDRNWQEDLEREKDKAGRRFFEYDTQHTTTTSLRRPPNGRSWEV
ncbi:hypothetical protein BCR39DRAFT_363326 [Naematelia encephala]|uniref:CBF1-interacting co-repressor CIR N-terminal domain-containing protein n=1 Tax=Naematelia encephala TaxID=71784 RepID=A0A1Y2AL42_9TREE|nr:hypothetical protein BCR39DRAFT_363326 [Naematelia encephala]